MNQWEKEKKMNQISFSNVTWKLLTIENSSYRPYQTGNNQIKYINIESNHPPSIIKQLQLSIKSKLSSLFSSEETFNDSVTPYQDVSDKAGYKHKFKYQVNINKTKNKKERKRNIIWFNPPYSKNLKTNIEKNISKSYKETLSRHQKLDKLFNKITVKIVYSCTRNIKTMINSHNAKILFPEKCTEQRISNFSNKVTCPLEQKYLTRNIVCKAKVTSRNQNYQEKVYFGLCETTFKKRFSNHKKSFNLNKCKNETKLSKEIWRLKDSSHYPKVKWEIVKKKSVLYNPQTKRCLLCLNKKL